MGISNLTIHELGPKGDGVHFGAQGRVYVARTAPGDRVQARVFKDEDGIARAEVVEMVAPSPYRQEPPCIHYDRCGSCTLQHLEPGFYRHWKTEMVKEAFAKQNLRPRQWLETLFLGSHNRRRATFSARKFRQQIVLGYYRRRSDELTDIDSCAIADPRLLELRELIKPSLSHLLIDGEPADFFFQIVGTAIDMVISGPIGRNGEPDAAVREVLTKLMKSSPITRITWHSYERDSFEPLVSKGPVIANFGSLKVSLPPAAFLQPTREGEQALSGAVMRALPELVRGGHFADLFSGCGTFSGPMLSRGSVDAYESVPRSVNALSKAAGSQPLKVFRRDLFRNPLRREEINRYDAVVFDPPRAGCPEQAMAMASAKTRTLVGVSCNPSTFARDARILCDGGYWLQSLQIVDQFLWSHHVEVVGVFTKRKRS